jgi:dihydrodipicolinate synthase/N-acetylneuraminate lyase
MDFEQAKARLKGCYVTVPTMFRDPDLELDLTATARNVRFLLERGIDGRYGTLLAGGAAGDFSTMTFDERVRVAEVVVAEADRRLPVAMGAQTTSTLELKRLTRAAERLGAEFIQVSPPFYFAHTEGDFYEYVCEAAAAADLGIVVYNTFWTSAGVSFRTIEKLIEIPNVIGLKWACPRTDAMEFEDVVSTFAGRLTIIDNHLMFAQSHMLGGAGFRGASLQLLAGMGHSPHRRPLAGSLPRRPASPGRAGDALLQALDRDREDLHERRRLPRQALHGVDRPRFQPLPAADPRYPAAVPRALPADDDPDRRPRGAAGLIPTDWLIHPFHRGDTMPVSKTERVLESLGTLLGTGGERSIAIASSTGRSRRPARDLDRGGAWRAGDQERNAHRDPRLRARCSTRLTV